MGVLENTNITLIDRTTKKINSLEYTECLLSCIINNKGKVDNVFKSTNELMDEIKNVEYNFVKSKLLNKWTEMVDIYLIINNKLKISLDHTIYYKGEGGVCSWNHVKSIRKGDFLLNDKLEYEKVFALKKIKEKSKISCMSISNKTYFADGYLIHNQTSCERCTICSVYRGTLGTMGYHHEYFDSPAELGIDYYGAHVWSNHDAGVNGVRGGGDPNAATPLENAGNPDNRFLSDDTLRFLPPRCQRAPTPGPFSSGPAGTISGDDEYQYRVDGHGHRNYSMKLPHHEHSGALYTSTTDTYSKSTYIGSRSHGGPHIAHGENPLYSATAAAWWEEMGVPDPNRIINFTPGEYSQANQTLNTGNKQYQNDRADHVYDRHGAKGWPSHHFSTPDGNGPSRGFEKNENFYNVVDGIQLWTVPLTGLYEIEVQGGCGGSTSERIEWPPWLWPGSVYMESAAGRHTAAWETSPLQTGNTINNSLGEGDPAQGYPVNKHTAAAHRSGSSGVWDYVWGDHTKNISLEKAPPHIKGTWWGYGGDRFSYDETFAQLSQLEDDLAVAAQTDATVAQLLENEISVKRKTGRIAKGGKGSRIKFQIHLRQGQVLRMVVGAAGARHRKCGGGGGASCIGFAKSMVDPTPVGNIGKPHFDGGAPVPGAPATAQPTPVAEDNSTVRVPGYSRIDGGTNEYYTWGSVGPPERPTGQWKVPDGVGGQWPPPWGESAAAPGAPDRDLSHIYSGKGHTMFRHQTHFRENVLVVAAGGGGGSEFCGDGQHGYTQIRPGDLMKDDCRTALRIGGRNIINGPGFERPNVSAWMTGAWLSIKETKFVNGGGRSDAPPENTVCRTTRDPWAIAKYPRPWRGLSMEAEVALEDDNYVVDPWYYIPEYVLSSGAGTVSNPSSQFSSIFLGGPNVPASGAGPGEPNYLFNLKTCPEPTHQGPGWLPTRLSEVLRPGAPATPLDVGGHLADWQLTEAELLEYPHPRYWTMDDGASAAGAASFTGAAAAPTFGDYIGLRRTYDVDRRQTTTLYPDGAEGYRRAEFRRHQNDHGRVSKIYAPWRSWANGTTIATMNEASWGSLPNEEWHHPGERVEGYSISLLDLELYEYQPFRDLTDDISGYHALLLSQFAGTLTGQLQERFSIWPALYPNESNATAAPGGRSPAWGQIPDDKVLLLILQEVWAMDEGYFEERAADGVMQLPGMPGGWNESPYFGYGADTYGMTNSDCRHYAIHWAFSLWVRHGMPRTENELANSNAPMAPHWTLVGPWLELHNGNTILKYQKDYAWTDEGEYGRASGTEVGKEDKFFNAVVGASPPTRGFCQWAINPEENGGIPALVDYRETYGREAGARQQYSGCAKIFDPFPGMDPGRGPRHRRAAAHLEMANAIDRGRCVIDGGADDGQPVPVVGGKDGYVGGTEDHDPVVPSGNIWYPFLKTRHPFSKEETIQDKDLHAWNMFIEYPSFGGPDPIWQTNGEEGANYRGYDNTTGFAISEANMVSATDDLHHVVGGGGDGGQAPWGGGGAGWITNGRGGTDKGHATTAGSAVGIIYAQPGATTFEAGEQPSEYFYSNSLNVEDLFSEETTPPLSGMVQNYGVDAGKSVHKNARALGGKGLDLAELVADSMVGSRVSPEGAYTCEYNKGWLIFTEAEKWGRAIWVPHGSHAGGLTTDASVSYITPPQGTPELDPETPDGTSNRIFVGKTDGNTDWVEINVDEDGNILLSDGAAAENILHAAEDAGYPLGDIFSWPLYGEDRENNAIMIEVTSWHQKVDKTPFWTAIGHKYGANGGFGGGGNGGEMFEFNITPDLFQTRPNDPTPGPPGRRSRAFTLTHPENMGEEWYTSDFNTANYINSADPSQEEQHGTGGIKHRHSFPRYSVLNSRSGPIWSGWSSGGWSNLGYDFDAPGQPFTASNASSVTKKWAAGGGGGGYTGGRGQGAGGGSYISPSAGWFARCSHSKEYDQDGHIIIRMLKNEYNIAEDTGFTNREHTNPNTNGTCPGLSGTSDDYVDLSGGITTLSQAINEQLPGLPTINPFKDKPPYYSACLIKLGNGPVNFGKTKTGDWKKWPGSDTDIVPEGELMVMNLEWLFEFSKISPHGAPQRISLGAHGITSPGNPYADENNYKFYFKFGDRGWCWGSPPTTFGLVEQNIWLEGCDNITPDEAEKVQFFVKKTADTGTASRRFKLFVFPIYNNSSGSVNTPISFDAGPSQSDDPIKAIQFEPEDGWTLNIGTN